MGCCYEIDINLFFISTLTLRFDEPIFIISVNIRIAAIDHNLLPRNESIDVIIEVSNEYYMTILDNVNILMCAGLWPRDYWHNDFRLENLDYCHVLLFTCSLQFYNSV